MPKMIGQTIRGAKQIDNDAIVVQGFTRITLAQARKLDVRDVACSLDTSDKGGPRRLAKRWFRWFGRIEAVRELGTVSAIKRAQQAQLISDVWARMPEAA